MKLYRLLIVPFVCLVGASAAVSAQTGLPDADPNAVQLTLQRAIEMALENNLDIVVSRLDTQVQADGVQFARGVYQPSISLGLNTLDSTSPAQTQLVGAQTLKSTRTNYNFTWQQQLGTGGNYNIQWLNVRSTTNSAFTGFNPLYDTVASAQITQPLMANFGTDASKQQIVVARNGERISRNQFEIQVMDTVRDVEFAYWDLVFAIRDLDVARRSLGLAEDLRRNNRIQVEVGTMAPIDVLEAEAEVAVRDETVILAEESIRVTEDTLKRLINDPGSLDFWSNSYAPIDQATIEEIDVDVDEAVRIALSRRPILEQTRVELETRNYNVRFAKNQLMPQLDVVGSLAFSGIGGTQLVRENFAAPPNLIIPGGYGDSIDQVFGGDFRDWSLGLNISYPLGNSQAEAQHAQAQVAARQQRALISSNEILIAQEVRTAARAVDTNRRRIDATRVAQELAERRLEAEQKKFEVGMSTSFLIVQAQRDLSQADANDLRALIDYVKAVTAFERAKGTILDDSNIAVR
ncbi:MAG: TolC family protein [Acidobacteriota bacterium]|nr:MAG: TolC family protein [Acidobacteriota bacterium]